MSPDPLALYRQLRERVDRFSAGVEAQLAATLACRPGCDSCCRLETVFPLEADAVYQALRQLPTALLEELSARPEAGDASCPLLHAGRCAIYAERPLICRTHGLPLLLEQDGATRIDHCPRNFAGLTSLPGSLVLQLESVNQPLAALNQLFLQQAPPGWELSGERIRLAELLRRALQDLQKQPDVV
jgi:uncharacterized protein